jgi:hypothetical protein
MTEIYADIDALKEFHEALARFRYVQRDVADRGDHETEATRASLEAKASRWQSRLEDARHELDACHHRAALAAQQERYLDCSGYAATVHEAQERLEHIRAWQQRVDEEAAAFRRTASRFRNLLEADLPHTQDHVMAIIKALEAARRIQAAG